MSAPYVTIDKARAAIGLPPLGEPCGLQLLDAKLLPEPVRPHRQRGVYVPAKDVQPLLELFGWQLLDDCPGCDECLLLPPHQDAAQAVSR